MVGQMGSRSSTFDASKWNLIHMIHIKTDDISFLRPCWGVPSYPLFFSFFSRNSQISIKRKFCLKLIPQFPSHLNDFGWFAISLVTTRGYGGYNRYWMPKETTHFCFSISSVNVNVFWLKFLISINK